MKEYPITFNEEMVLALLNNKKIKTRRPVKRIRVIGEISDFKEFTAPGTFSLPGARFSFTGANGDNHIYSNRDMLELCPYGRVGDRLWVQEDFAYLDCSKTDSAIIYKSDRTIFVREKSFVRAFPPRQTSPEIDFYWEDPRSMPRWASRIVMEVVNVRLEPLQNITEDGAIAEGITRITEGYINPSSVPPERIELTYRDYFRDLWNRIYGSTEFAWENNRWVWVISFRRVEQ